MSELGDVPRDEQAARIRAAIGYSGMEIREVAAAVAERLGRGFSYPTLRRRYNGDEPEGFRSLDELYALAAVCDVPDGFLLEGFSQFERPADGLAARLQRLEDRLDALDEVVQRQLLRVVAEAHPSAPPRPGETGQTGAE